jgi:hypothetical protein
VSLGAAAPAPAGPPPPPALQDPGKPGFPRGRGTGAGVSPEGPLRGPSGAGRRLPVQVARRGNLGLAEVLKDGAGRPDPPPG